MFTNVVGLPFESVTIKTKDGANLHAYFIRHPGQKGDFCPTLVYFHGNAGNNGHRLQNANGIYHNLQCKLKTKIDFRIKSKLELIQFSFFLILGNLLLVEYRGYGLSTGVPTEKGLYIDARSSIDYLYTRHDLDHSQIFLFGRSLGKCLGVEN